MQKQRKWLEVPPKVDLNNLNLIIGRISRLNVKPSCMSIALALETDSTRVVSFLVRAGSGVYIDGEKLSAGYHGLSHHGNNPDKIAEFNRSEKSM